jgi:signal transduction histidine kinase
VTAATVPSEAVRPTTGDRSSRLTALAWAQLAVAAGLTVLTVVLVSMAGAQDPAQAAGWPRIAGPIAMLELSAVGGLIAARHVRNPIGWIFAFAGLDGLLGEVAKQYVNVGLSRGSGSLPAVPAMAFVAMLSAISTAWPVLTFGFLLFPDGRLPSRRWRPVAWVAAGSTLLVTVVVAIAPGPLGLEFPSMANPFGVDTLSRAGLEVVANAGVVVQIMSVIASVAAMLVRLRRASGEERQQIKWVAYGACLVASATVVGIFWHPLPGHSGSFEGPIAVTVLTVAFALAIFRFRLFDIDIVISRTVLYALLGAFITTVYLAIVVGLGTAIGSRGQQGFGLSIAAAAVIAAIFQPVRARLERLANRLVYGDRAAPYEVLAQCSRLAATYRSEDVLPRLARLIVDGTGGARADVWLVSGQQQRRVTTWPDHPGPERTVVRTVLVHHGGELLGALAVHSHPGIPLTPPRERLLTDLAGQAGLLLRNVRLIDDLRSSRERLVTATDAERRRLEADIGQQVERRLLAVADTLSMGASYASSDEERDLIDRLRDETAGALAELRDLARGIYPPLLAAEGLVVALRSQARDGPVPVEVRAADVGRYADEVEAAAYFCCLEALQNVAKHARAAKILITLSRDPERLVFTVDDDGVGFDPSDTSGSGLQNMADRAAALGGRVRITSAPGRGSTVTGWLPGTVLESVQ